MFWMGYVRDGFSVCREERRRGEWVGLVVWE